MLRRKHEKTLLLLGVTLLAALSFAPSPLPTNAQITTPKIVTPSKLSFDEINTSTRKALVNIICRSRTNSVGGTVGTGILIDDRGIILTNAHVAQYFLLEKRFGLVSCFIRNGNPARGTNKADLLYISDQWLKNNNKSITSSEPTGSGQFDFGLLLLATTTGLSPKPAAIPYTVDESTFDYGDQVLAAAYPAGLLGNYNIEFGLYTSSALPLIQDLYTFNEGTKDLIILSGNVVAQKGSSGGAVTNNKGRLFGLISTVTEGKTTGERTLGAISLSHINKTMYEEIGATLGDFLEGDIRGKLEQYQNTTGRRQAAFLLESILHSLSR